MINQKLFNLFKRTFPCSEVEDYRPFSDMFIPMNKQGIIIWLKNGDTIIYFSSNKDIEINEVERGQNNEYN